jgi:hypothetical protein
MGRFPQVGDGFEMTSGRLTGFTGKVTKTEAPYIEVTSPTGEVVRLFVND